MIVSIVADATKHFVDARFPALKRRAKLMPTLRVEGLIVIYATTKR